MEWSAAVEYVSMRFHIICHTSRKMNHLCSTTLFSQDAECNANSQSRHTGENRSEIALEDCRRISLSLARSLSPPRSR